MGDKPWIIKINNEMNNIANPDAESIQWKKRSIYKVSDRLAYLNRISPIEYKTVYKPLMVSIGPYHHGDWDLRAMEEHKRRALLHVLKRSKKPLQSFVDALAPVVPDLIDAYDQLTNEWHGDTEAFMELLIVDGCFILEILRTFRLSRISTFHGDDKGTEHNYAANDPIFSSHGMSYIVPYLQRDMLMLENQIPMLVLDKLVAVQNDQSTIKTSEDLMKAIHKFFTHTHVERTVPCLHILDLYRKSLFLTVDRHANKNRTRMDYIIYQVGDIIIRSATELFEAGIRIRRSRTRSLEDISFSGGVLKLPHIVVDEEFESKYMNLIAFERFYVDAGNEIASYIFFMDNIIHDERDVKLLQSRGIILNGLGSDEAVVNLFNTLSKDITLGPESSLYEVHKQVYNYCQRRWNKWRYHLMHNYFNNPLVITSVTNAICLFILTIVHTVTGVN